MEDASTGAGFPARRPVAWQPHTFLNAPGVSMQDPPPGGYAGCCFVLLGYCRGDYPREKPRKPGRYTIIE